jgi:hypothetical protein
LIYTTHSSRFLSSFLILMPFALWESAGSYWNHWITIPETYAAPDCSLQPATHPI